MNKIFVPALIIACSAPLSHADLSVYGKADVSWQYTDLESDASEQWELNSNASRLGVKGELPLEDSGITAFAKAEYEIAIDDGDTGDDKTFKQRDIYVGLKGAWGSVQAGTFDTATKLLGKEVDLFNDLAIGDIKNILVAERRVENTVQYSAPELIAGLGLSAAIVPGEDGTGEENNAADGSTVSARYSRNNWFFGLSRDEEIDGYNTLRAVTSTRVGPAKVGLLLQTAEQSDQANPDEQDAVVLSAQLRLSEKCRLNLQYGLSETDSVSGDSEASQIAIGSDYALSKSLLLYSYAALVQSEDDAGNTSDDATAGIGLSFKF